MVAPKKQEQFRRSKLLVVHPVDPQGALMGQGDLLALDPQYGAGIGDLVLVAKEGAVVAQLLGEVAPANVIVLGVVDDWTYTA